MLRASTGYTGTRMKLLTVLFTIGFLFPAGVHAAPLNAGFVQGLWYAQEPVFAEQPNRIYVAFRNNTPDDITGTVHFSVDGTRIGSSDVRALAGRVVEAWVDWTPKDGMHAVTATIENAQAHKLGGDAVSVDIASLSAESALTVDRDSDKDGIGNAADADDDDDGISDEEERTRGSSPTAASPQTVPANETGDSTPYAEDSGTERGLERFTDEGPADMMLGAVTQKIDDAKDAIDTYRAERAETLHDTLLPQENDAGITRTKIEQGGWWAKFVLGIQAILAHVWTFILWLLSNVLAHPIFVQVGVLVGILYLLYRTARQFGQRPTF